MVQDPAHSASSACDRLASLPSSSTAASGTLKISLSRSKRLLSVSCYVDEPRPLESLRVDLRAYSGEMGGGAVRVGGVN